MLLTEAPLHTKANQEKMTHHVQDLQYSHHVSDHSGCAIPVHVWPNHWYCHGLWEQGNPHCAHLYVVLPAPCRPMSGHGWPGPEGLHIEVTHRERL